MILKSCFCHEQILKKCPIKSKCLRGISPHAGVLFKKCDNAKNRTVTIAISTNGVMAGQTLVPSFVIRVIFFVA